MIFKRKSQLVGAICCVSILAGCGAPQQVEKNIPTSALECRKEIYDNPNQRSVVSATGGGLSIGASLAIAVVSGALSHSLASSSEARQLNECYDSVGAEPSERLSLSRLTHERDKVLLAGGSVEDANRAVTHPARRGSGGGAGFGSF